MQDNIKVLPEETPRGGVKQQDATAYAHHMAIPSHHLHHKAGKTHSRDFPPRRTEIKGVLRECMKQKGKSHGYSDGADEERKRKMGRSSQLYRKLSRSAPA